MLENLSELMSTVSTSYNTFNIKDTANNQPKKTFKLKDFFQDSSSTEDLIGMLEHAV